MSLFPQTKSKSTMSSSSSTPKDNHPTKLDHSISKLKSTLDEPNNVELSQISQSNEAVKLDISEPNPRFPNISGPILTKIMLEKDLEKIKEYGSVKGVVSALRTDPEKGIFLEVEEMSSRREAFGTNTYPLKPLKSFFYFVWEALKDITILILLACAILSLGFGIKENGLKEGWYDGGSVFVAVFLVTVVSSVSNYRQSRQFDKLSRVSRNIMVDVVRDGRAQKVSIFDIVVGDIVCLRIGDQVPADGLLVEGHSLCLDESSRTGESEHVEINEETNPFLFSGTKVADGYGKMMVASVGMNTTWGEMMSLMNRDSLSEEETPLQARLNRLTPLIGKVGLAIAFLVLVILLSRYFSGSTKDVNGNARFDMDRKRVDDIVNAIVGIVANAVTILVIAIPEGFPLAVTLTLAYTMRKMMRDNAMVRKLSACETMGSVDTICTDKTGTLTLNQMKVIEFWLGHDLVKEENYMSMATNVLELLYEAIGLNTTATVYKSSNLESQYEFTGSPTEKAILSWAVLELNFDMEETQRNSTVLHVEAFNSTKKRSGVLMRRTKDIETMSLHWKGASEMILDMCSHYYDLSGNIQTLDDSERKRYEGIIKRMSTSSLRCIGFAHKKVRFEDHRNAMVEKDLILLGFIGIKDPCRPGAKKAVEDCQMAGVNVKMITGDNLFTAIAIAIECGILRPDQHDLDTQVVEGVTFRSYTPEERMKKVENILVMARSSPFDKLEMVQCLKKKGHIVAVTGDGTNDALALKEANIGLSMGIQGTEVAKESSDIVILDDNFNTIVTVLKWGRCVSNNIQKFIQFQMTINVAAISIQFVGAVSTGEVPLTIVQLLWVNLIMDTMAALALATEKPTDDLLMKKPTDKTEPIITNIMWRNLLSQAIYQMSILLIMQFKGETMLGVSKKVNNTMIFNVFVLCQVFNEFNARKLEKKNVFEGVVKNKPFLAIIGITIVLQVVMVELLNKFADTIRLSLWQWGISVAIAALSLPLALMVKCIPVPQKPIFSSK
ncbi:putative calcium-transporting ATPase 13, plasma membrane-type [Impatiens glandulifera]|uniref:putative calcium-transporting ATPase 13, plasma membrane-type n=1 Tax=Impatiens glandulifera TaxID=253017 RepID=UPI001FB16D72|nr:putative calcium-transporting ATPase 13, plasma membrane-type [Impatiens glandulifera]